MSQQPPPPPYGGPPMPYLPGGRESRSGMSNKAKFWIGVALAIPALIVSGIITSAGAALVDFVGGDPALGATLSTVLGLLVLAGFIAMVVHPRTRWLALGIMAGTAVLFILFAGACVALIVAYSNGV
jgi:hypothetical protein